MAYNPGIAARGEILGQSIGAAGQSIAQQYGEGLKLQEEQDRYNKEQKRLKKDRRNLEKANEVRAGVLIDAQYPDNPDAAKKAKEATQAMDPGELEGWLQGQAEAMAMRSHKATHSLNVLQLGEFQEAISQKPIMRQAMSDMAMGSSEQNLSPMDSLNLAMSMNPDLSDDNVLKLNQLVQARQSIQMEGKVLELRELANLISEENAKTNQQNAITQGKQVDLAQDKFDQSEEIREEGPKATDVEGLPNYKAVTLPDGGTSLVSTKTENKPDLSVGSSEGRSITANTDELITDIDLISEGDDRYGLNMFSRNNHAMDQIKTITKKNREFKAKYGKNHPDIKRLQIRVAPFISEMKNSSDSTYKKLAKQLARELGITID
jgi:hypothetical protein